MFAKLFGVIALAVGLAFASLSWAEEKPVSTDRSKEASKGCCGSGKCCCAGVSK
jgi:hypothetical protein